MKNKNVLTASDHGLLLINRNDNTIGGSISMSGSWESKYIIFLKNLIRTFYPANSTIEIIDAGANIGIYALEMSNIEGLNTKVIAIEAQRLVFQILNANVALNSLENVWTYHRVISDKNDEAVVLECPDLNFPANFGSYEIQKDLIHSDHDGKFLMPPEKVMTITLDSLTLENCALLKLDVEGMEDLALAGSINLIKKFKPIIFFERHKTNYQKIQTLLKECRYAVWELPEGNTLGVRMEWDLKIDNFERIDLAI